MIFPKKNESAKLEIELKKLIARRDLLSSRLVSSRSAEATAFEAQRTHLIEGDDSDASIGNKLAADIEAAARDAAALADAISTLDDKIAECRAAAIAAHELAERERRIDDIGKRIKTIEPLAAEAEKAFEKLIGVVEKIAATVGDRDLEIYEYRHLIGHGSRLPVTSIIGASIAEAMFRSMPDAFTVEKSVASIYARASLPLMARLQDGLSSDLPIDDDSFAPLPLSGALTANVIDPLRKAADEIRDGSRPIAAASPSLIEEAEKEPVFEHRRLIFTKPCRWRDWNGNLVETPDSDQTVAWPVAAAAVAARVAFNHGNKEAEHHLDWRLNRGIRNDAIPSSNKFVELIVLWPMQQEPAA